MIYYYAWRCEKGGNSGTSLAEWPIVRHSAKELPLLSIDASIFESCRFGERSVLRAGSPVDPRCSCARRSRQISKGTSENDAGWERPWLPCTQRNRRHGPLWTDGIIIGTSKQYKRISDWLLLYLHSILKYLDEYHGASSENHWCCHGTMSKNYLWYG